MGARSTGCPLQVPRPRRRHPYSIQPYAFNVGQGDATLLEFPCAAMLVDTDGQKHISAGQTVMDAHIHLRSLALKTVRCDLGAAGSLEEALETLVGWASGQDTPVLMGVDWDETRWPVGTRPTRNMLDERIPDRPVFMRRICGHVAVVNSAFQKIL